jgi:CheY-like chemotaxis protein
MKENGVIFLLENSTDYLYALDQAFRKAGLTNPIKVTRYGNEAILYLKGVGIYQDRVHYPLPDVILIDMSLPDGSAMSVIGWLRRQPQFDEVPVLVLIGSLDQRFVSHSGSENTHWVKRDDYEAVVELLKAVQKGEKVKKSVKTNELARHPDWH